MSTIELKVPDIGGSADVIELLVKVGEAVSVNQSLLTLESDKATMEVPATQAGILKQWQVNVGDKVNEDDVIAILDVAENVGAPLAAPIAIKKIYGSRTARKLHTFQRAIHESPLHFNQLFPCGFPRSRE